MKHDWMALNPDGKPLYVLLADYLRDAISRGVLKDGEKLPGRNKLADSLNVSKNTLVSALDTLEKEGLLYSSERCGTVVCSSNKHGVDWDSYTKKAFYRFSSQKFKNYFGHNIANFTLSSEFDILPYSKQAMVAGIEALSNKSILVEFTKYGFTPLIEDVKRYVSSFGINVDTSNILITADNLHSMACVYAALVNRGFNFLYDKNNIINTVSGIHPIGCNMVPLQTDEYGIKISDLERKIQQLPSAILHIDPTENAPTGLVTSKKRRCEIMKVLERYNIPAIEVDHAAHIWHRRSGLNPLKSMDINGNIVYIGTFAKPYIFDTQISWIIASKYMIEYLSDVFAQVAYKPNPFSQIVIHHLMTSGLLSTISDDIKKFVEERRDFALSLCEEYLKPYAIWNERNCWYYFWLDFPDTNIAQMFKKEVDIDFYPGYMFNKDDKNHILLCPACITKEALIAAVKRISEMARKNR